jgi:hypothetical protein
MLYAILAYHVEEDAAFWTASISWAIVLSGACVPGTDLRAAKI